MNVLSIAGSENLIYGLTLKQVMAIAIPVIAIQLGFVIAAFVNLKRQGSAELRGGKALWAVILAFSLISYPLGLLGPVFYFTIGRKPLERD